MKINNKNESQFTATFTAEELNFADIACQKVFKSSLVDVMSDFEKNNAPMPVEFMESMIEVGKGFNRANKEETV